MDSPPPELVKARTLWMGLIFVNLGYATLSYTGMDIFVFLGIFQPLVLVLYFISRYAVDADYTIPAVVSEYDTLFSPLDSIAFSAISLLYLTTLTSLALTASIPYTLTVGGAFLFIIQLCLAQYHLWTVTTTRAVNRTDS